MPQPPVQEGYFLQLIAQGSGTRVFRCLKQGSQEEDSKIVLKTITHKNGCHSQACSNLHAEHQILQKFDHININKSYQYQNVVTDDGWQFCTMQTQNCVSDLYSYIKHAFPRVNLAKLLTWFKQTTEALEHIHNNYETGHFDIKPENIGISKRGNVKLLDFGFSFCYQKPENEVLQKLWKNRSKLYLAPEILEQCLKNDLQGQCDFSCIDWQKIDVFALAVTFFSCIFYKSPLPSGQATKLDPLYSFVVKDDFEGFWKQDEQVMEILQSLEEVYGSENIENLKDVFWQSLISKQDKRATLKDIINHRIFSQLRESFKLPQRNLK